MKILFVCTGNTCRSCMAEAIAKNEAKIRGVDIEFLSAGIFAFKGASASENAQKVMNQMEIDLSKHTATPLSQEMLEDADLVLTMTLSHKNAILSAYPLFSSKIYTLKEYIGENGDIQDPFGGSVDIYNSCAQELKRAIDLLFSKLKES